MTQLRKIRSGVLQGVSLKQEAISASKEGSVGCGAGWLLHRKALPIFVGLSRLCFFNFGQEIVGMDVNQNRPLLCLQTTVRNKCAEKVVSALAAALHVLCDQGSACSLGSRLLDLGWGLPKINEGGPRVANRQRHLMGAHKSLEGLTELCPVP